MGLKYNKEIYKRIKIKNKLPRKNSNVVEGFWKRYTIGNVSRAGDGEVEILERTRKLVNKHYFDKLLILRENYFAFREKYNFN